MRRITRSVKKTRKPKAGAITEGAGTQAQATAPTTKAAHESEARYQALFDTLIEGFCTIEMIFDGSGKPVCTMRRAN